MIIGIILDAKNDGRPVKGEEFNQVINNITVEAPNPSASPAPVPSGPVDQSPEQVEAGRRVNATSCVPVISSSRNVVAQEETRYGEP